MLSRHIYTCILSRMVLIYRHVLTLMQRELILGILIADSTKILQILILFTNGLTLMQRQLILGILLAYCFMFAKELEKNNRLTSIFFCPPMVRPFAPILSLNIIIFTFKCVLSTQGPFTDYQVSTAFALVKRLSISSTLVESAKIKPCIS